jgi:hypothetical protein
MNRVSRVLAAGAAGLALAAGAFAATAAVGPAALAGDSPGAFHYGTDSWPVSGTGSAPYVEPHTGGSYGGYMGMAGNWARTVGCHTGNFLAWSSANSAQANTNLTKYNTGVGTGVYWYMGGPGVDPHYKGTTAEASAWGAQQAAWTLAAVKSLGVVKYPVIWADIELPGIEPAPDNGWNAVYTGPCSWHVAHYHIPASIDRAELNGFSSYISSHSAYKVGVYSSPGVWTSIFGTGPESRIPNTYEWTYESETKTVSAASAPWGWCLSRGHGACAAFFGGQTSGSAYALMWQWSGGGGVNNGYGDFDQIDVARMK